MELHEEDANISAFRRGNKIIAVGLAMIVICAMLLILRVASVFLLPRPALLSVESFCSYSNAEICITALDSVVPDRYATAANQIVALCIQTAAKDLQNLIDSNKIASDNCSDSLRIASDRVRESLARAKRPVLGRVRDEVVINWLVAAEGDLRFCLEESPEVTAKLDYVRAYLYSADGFLRLAGTEINNSFNMETPSQIDLFGICLCGMQLFAFGFVCSRFRKHSAPLSLTRIWNTQ